MCVCVHVSVCVDSTGDNNVMAVLNGSIDGDSCLCW